MDALDNKIEETDTIIVLGSRGNTGIKKMLTGRYCNKPVVGAPPSPPLPLRSCVSQVLARGVAPCVVVRSTLPPQPTSDAPSARRRVAIAVDASPSGAALCAWASAALLRPSSDEVVLLHARSASTDAAADDATLAVLKSAVSRLRDAPGRVGTGYAQPRTAGEGASPAPPLEPKIAVLSDQSSGAAIVAWCDAHRPHMLVVGSRGASWGRGPSSVSLHALAFAPCPVLVVDASTLAELTHVADLKPRALYLLSSVYCLQVGLTRPDFSVGVQKSTWMDKPTFAASMVGPP